MKKSGLEHPIQLSIISFRQNKKTHNTRKYTMQLSTVNTQKLYRYCHMIHINNTYNCLPFWSSCVIRFGVPTAMCTTVLFRNFACSVSWNAKHNMKNKMTSILHNNTIILLRREWHKQYSTSSVQSVVKCSLWNVLQTALQPCSHQLWNQKFLYNSRQSHSRAQLLYASLTDKWKQ